jgi:hypothetical protein
VKNLKKAAAITMIVGGVLVTGAGAASANGVDAHSTTVGSRGILSGNVIQVPVHVPVNACGNTVNVVGAMNPSFGNSCVTY